MTPKIPADCFMQKISVDHHDMGFLYSPSCVAAYKLTGNTDAKTAAILAADQLLTRFQPVGGFLQAWGPMDQKENYRLSAESVELVNRKYHDLKHQIRLLRSEISSGDKLHYLDEMEQEIKSYEAQNKTGNDALDVLLTAKSIQCQNAGITLTCVADGKELSFLKPTDLSVLFGNALDNAFESVEKIEDPEKRLIHLSVARQKQFVRIRVENCCEGEIRFVDGLPATGKDANYHGYGMKSIRSIVEKYNGSMTVKVQDGWFELRILLPLQNPEPDNA